MWSVLRDMVPRYTGHTEARNLLIKREEDGYREKVEEWWKSNGLTLPEIFTTKRPPSVRYAILARQVATFRYEDAVFAIMAERAGLTPLWLTYTKDKLVSASPYKMSLFQPSFVQWIGRRGGIQRQRYNLADLNQWDGQAISDIRVLHNGRKMSLARFHHNHLRSMYLGACVTDLSEINTQLGNKEQYYPFFLSLAVAHGVLFEDYHGGESGGRLSSLTGDVFEPAAVRVMDKLGAKPIVVKLPWWPELAYYPSVDFCRKMSWRTHGFALGSFAAKPRFS